LNASFSWLAALAAFVIGVVFLNRKRLWGGDNPASPSTNESNIQISIKASGRVVSGFSYAHFRAAVTFRNSLIAIERDNRDQRYGPFFSDVRTYGGACFMSAAAALEALINELFIAHGGRLRSQITEFEKTFWGRNGIERENTLEKYQRALRMIGAEEFSASDQLFRSAWALIELRNMLIHFKPSWDPASKREIDVTDVLAGRFALSPFVDEGADFITMRCMSAGAAEWAVESVLAFVSEFQQRTDLLPAGMHELFVACAANGA
jgi:hypothetical protein